MAQILTTMLAVAVIACFVPQMGAPVYAADGDPAMVVGAESVLKSTANTDDAQTVYYGTNEENSIAWRVISFDGTGNKYTKSSGVMTLLASEILASGQQFNPYEEQDNDYKGSSLQSAVDGLFDNLFSEKEQRLAMVEKAVTVAH